MGESIMQEGSENEKNNEREDSNKEKEEKKKKGRTYPRIGEIPG